MVQKEPVRSVNAYTHAVTHVTDKLLTSIKTIVRLSGLSPDKLTTEWVALERGITTWLRSQDLEQLHLEVYDFATGRLVGRWDFQIFYGFQGDGAFWVDPDAIKYHIQKQGLWPGSCQYRIVATTKPGRLDVPGWSSTTMRSTHGFVKQGIGTAIQREWTECRHGLLEEGNVMLSTQDAFRKFRSRLELNKKETKGRLAATKRSPPGHGRGVRD